MMRRKSCSTAAVIVRGIRSRPRVAAAALMVLAVIWTSGPAPVSAQSIYTCKDEHGRALSSDRPIPECAHRPMLELNNSGVVKREISAPLTKEQLRQKDLDEQQKRVVENLRRQQESRDKGLMLAFANVDALERTRTRQVDDINDNIAAAQRRMISSHQELKVAQAAADAIKGRPVPEAMLRRIRQIAQVILDDDALIVKLRAEHEQINQQFDRDAIRLRMLLREEEFVQVAVPQQP
jgi:hypothetical protein